MTIKRLRDYGIYENRLAQLSSKMSFPFVMNNGRLFIANLSKGRLGHPRRRPLGAACCRCQRQAGYCGHLTTCRGTAIFSPALLRRQNRPGLIIKPSNRRISHADSRRRPLCAPALPQETTILRAPMFGFRHKRAEVLSHWYSLVPNFNSASKEFYEAVEKELKERQVPGLDITRAEFAEGGLLSGKREYLRMTRERLVFDICAAPFGTSYFFSCRFAEIPSLGSSVGIAALAGRFIRCRPRRSHHRLAVFGAPQFNRVSFPCGGHADLRRLRHAQCGGSWTQRPGCRAPQNPRSRVNLPVMVPQGDLLPRGHPAHVSRHRKRGREGQGGGNHRSQRDKTRPVQRTQSDSE